jgi:CPA1 family monovalent cation:H+ antiporter
MLNSLLLYTSLLIVILLLVMLARKVNIAYPIILVLGGLVVSFIPHMPAISIDPEIIFVIFLPPLLYEAAWATSWKELWKWRRVISSFAFLIVIVTALVVALVSARFIPGFTLALGFLLGGIVSPPDAVSASTVLKNIKVPKRMLAIIEGESLLNDAASLIVFRFALIAINTGTFVLHEAAGSFFIVIILGIAVGLGVGLVFYAIHRWLPTTSNMDILLTFIEPYIMYIVAERFHVSGVLAVVSGGLFLRSRSYSIMGYRSRFQGQQVWSTIAFALNGFIFLLIGLELPVLVRALGPDGLPFAIKCGLMISLLLIVLRLLCTFGASAFTVFISRYITTADSRPGWKAPLIFGWAGMRGVVSLAAALSIPLFLPDGTPFPYRNLILFITFTVIIVTLVLQGLTLPALVRLVNLPELDYQRSTQEQEIILRKKMSMRALEVMDQRYARQYRNNCWVLSLESRLKSDVSMLGQIKFTPLGQGDGVAAIETAGVKETLSISYADYRMVSLDLVQAQRQLLHELNKKEELDERVIRKYQNLLDLEEEKMRRQFGEDE